jgi:hypothetical protein
MGPTIGRTFEALAELSVRPLAAQFGRSAAIVGVKLHLSFREESRSTANCPQCAEEYGWRQMFRRDNCSACGFPVRIDETVRVEIYASKHASHILKKPKDDTDTDSRPRCRCRPRRILKWRLTSSESEGRVIMSVRPHDRPSPECARQANSTSIGRSSRLTSRNWRG